MKGKLKPLIFLVPVIALGLCSCYSEDYFVRKLDKQFGEGTYTFAEDTEDKGSSYIVTLNDYPSCPFRVGRGVAGLPYEFSTFQGVFAKAIYDEYAKEGVDNDSLYELTYDGYFRFELERDMNAGEAEGIYDETEKLLSIINDKYPVYNTQDYSIGVNRWKYEENPIAVSYLLAACHNGSLQVSSKEDFLAYQQLVQEETNPPIGEGITIKNELTSTITLGVDTLRTIVLKGFHIDGFENYQSMVDTMIEPGGKGMSAWCNLDSSLGYVTIPLGAAWNADALSEKKNYVYVETTNLGTEPCALKDTIVTKVVYHFYHIERNTTASCYLGLDGRWGDITRGDSGFDLSARWEIGQPQTEEEKQNGVRYKDILVKIQNKLYRQGLLEKLTDAPPYVKQLEITLMWEPGEQ